MAKLYNKDFTNMAELVHGRNRFNILGNPNLMTPAIDKKEQDFPPLSSVSQTIITHSKYKQALTKNNTNNNIQANMQLFADDNLVLKYTDILKMRDQFAIYRIRMQYLLLNIKIHILDSLYMLDQEKATQLKSSLGYDKFMQDKMVYGNIIEICILLNETLQKLKNLSNLLQENIHNPHNTTILKNFMETFNYQNVKYDINNIIITSNNIFDKYVTNIYELLESIQDYIHSIYSESINHREIQTHIMNNIDVLLEIIIQDFDPKIDCQYYVNIDSSNQFIFTPIAISSSIFLDCSQPISLATQNKNIDDEILLSLDQQKFNSLFYEREFRNYTDYFIRIYNGSNKIKINFNILDPVPDKNFMPKIIGLPSGSKFLSNIIKPAPAMPVNNLYLPIYTESRLYRRSKQPCLDKKDYDTLPLNIKNQYSRNNTNLNIFFADFIFNLLVENDDTSSIIQDKMLDSFRILANNTSRIN